MQQDGHDSTTSEPNGHSSVKMKKHGHASAVKKKSSHANGIVKITLVDLRIILAGMQAMCDGDFSVRLPGDWTGWKGRLLTGSTRSSPLISVWRRSWRASGKS